MDCASARVEILNVQSTNVDVTFNRTWFGLSPSRLYYHFLWRCLAPWSGGGDLEQLVCDHLVKKAYYVYDWIRFNLFS